MQIPNYSQISTQNNGNPVMAVKTQNDHLFSIRQKPFPLIVFLIPLYSPSFSHSRLIIIFLNCPNSEFSMIKFILLPLYSLIPYRSALYRLVPIILNLDLNRTLPYQLFHSAEKRFLTPTPLTQPHT